MGSRTRLLFKNVIRPVLSRPQRPVLRFFSESSIVCRTVPISFPLSTTSGLSSLGNESHKFLRHILSALTGFACAQYVCDSCSDDWPVAAQGLLTHAPAKQDVVPGISVEFLSELQRAVGSERVVTDEEERDAHAKPWNSYHKMVQRPDAVVYPR